MVLQSEKINHDGVIGCILPKEVEDSLLECLVFKPIVFSDEKEIRQ
jgi:hypothetical protein